MLSTGHGIDIGQKPKPKTGVQNQNIAFPNRVAFAESLPAIQSAIKLPTLDKVQSVPGFDQSYWDSLYKQSQGRLSSQFFGPQDSLQTKMIENLNARGLLGSGVEQKGFQNLSKSYGEQLADLETNISKQQSEQKFAEAQKVRELQQQRDIQSGEWEMQGSELGLRSALTEAAEANKFNIGKFEQEVKLEDVMRQDSVARQKLLVDLLTSPTFELPSDYSTGSMLDTIFGGYRGQSIYGGDIKGGNSTYTSRNYGSSYVNTDEKKRAALEQLKKKYKTPLYSEFPALGNNTISPYGANAVATDFGTLLANL